ncbi:hypothetical protein DL769_002398 [Monosporascus sp. CRB-8-3]|nr:hypothetical protein DL769_002398 [Monosporascus sp. CRB-8-3]
MCLMMIGTGVSGISSPLSSASQAANAARILFNGIDAPKPKVTGAKHPKVSASEDIVLWNVNFTYPTRPELKVLDDLKLIIPAGRVTAIVGPSGSGKSTLVALIERWYELDGDMDKNKLIMFFRNGLIRVGQHKLQDIDLKWWRSQIGLVEQEPFLFDDTIFENVANGLIGTEWENAGYGKKKDLVEKACKESFADEFINRLPEGYNTRVGDVGIRLSGGQRQRLAIARAIIRNPKILILDEATSSIDNRGEKVVQAALDRVSKDRTTIMIAHRLSTVQKAENIIVLAKGKVVQWGNHNSLMAAVGGPYWLLVNSQGLEIAEADYPENSADVSEHEKRTTDLMTLDKSEAVVRESVSTRAGDTEYEPKGVCRSFWTLLLDQKPYWSWYILMIFGALVTGASSPLQAYLLAAIISSFALQGDYLTVITNFWCLMFVTLAGGAGVGYFCLGFASTKVSFHIASAYKQEYFEGMISKAVSWFDGEGHSIATLAGLLANDPVQLHQLLGINMAFVATSVLSVTGCLIIAFYFGWKLTLVALVSAMPLAMAAGFFRVRIEKAFERMNVEIFATSAKWATESIAANRTVTALTMEDRICDRYEKLLQDHVTIPTAELGAIGAGHWLSFVPTAANRIQSMRLKSLPSNGGSTILNEATIDSSRGAKIEFLDVWFRYPSREAPVLSGLNMTIGEGQFAAIVGPSGSIISLLERFYKANSGVITYDGHDIEEIGLCDYRKTISLVAQESNLFNGTIRENILVGVDETETTENSDNRMFEACRDAGIHDFVMSLPEGYDTVIGSKGVLLSGGQKQRISIARALVRRPRLLLLDEATSNLDSETEKQIQETFERTRKGRTMIVVAHRLATVKNADVIFVLGDGQVQECGTHTSLLQKRGVYHNMCLAQALDR